MAPVLALLGLNGNLNGTGGTQSADIGNRERAGSDWSSESAPASPMITRPQPPTASGSSVASPSFSSPGPSPASIELGQAALMEEEEEEEQGGKEGRRGGAAATMLAASEGAASEESDVEAEGGAEGEVGVFMTPVKLIDAQGRARGDSLKDTFSDSDTDGHGNGDSDSDSHSDSDSDASNASDYSQARKTNDGAGEALVERRTEDSYGGPPPGHIAGRTSMSPPVSSEGESSDGESGDSDGYHTA